MLIFTQGDDAVLNLLAKMSDGTRVDLTGAVFTTRVRGLENEVVEFPNDQHTANPNQTTHRGEFTLALTGEDTETIKAGESQEIITKIEIGDAVVYYHGANQMTVLSADPTP